MQKTTEISLARILLVDDHSVVLNGLAMLIDTQPDMKVAGLADSVAQALELLANGVEVDLLIVDLNLPGQNGFELLAEIRQRQLQLKTAVLSMRGSESDVDQAVQLGASGYLLKSVDPEELLFAIRHIIKGNFYICSESAAQLLQNYNSSQKKVANAPLDIELSDREEEILQLIAQGLTNNEMADRLFLSKRTIEGHRQSLLDKTNSKNTAALIRYAAISGLLN